MSDFEPTTSVPQPIAGFDSSTAAIGALERMVLAHVDGRASVADVASATGLEHGDVQRVLARLSQLGALRLVGGPAAPVPGRDVPTTNVGWDPALLEEACDLEVEVRRRVLDLFHALDDLDHYALLAVPRDADRKAIKSAYYALAAKLHTDRYFGKNLGSFKSKMEAVFGRMTIAHDTLASKARRAEYDEYLKDRDRTRAYEQLLQHATVDAAPTLHRAPPLPRTPPTPEVAAPSPTPAPVSTPMPFAAPAAPAAAPAATSTPRPPPPVAPLTPEQERARRVAAAQRLAGNRLSTGRMQAISAPVRPPSGVQRVATPTAEEAKAATETIRARYQDTIDQSRRATVKRLVDAAEESIAKGDFIAAANHLRLALNHGDDPQLRAKYDAANARAREIMAETYLKQASYEESQDKWREAGESYAKASEARPGDADIAAKAANALRREGRDLHRAARFGESAVQKNPASPEFRVTLGLVYLDAGLLLRAKSEFEQAVRLAPEDAKAKELLVRVRKTIG